MNNFNQLFWYLAHRFPPLKGPKAEPLGLANAPPKSRAFDLQVEPSSLLSLSLTSFRDGATWWGHSHDTADVRDIKIKHSTGS